MGAARGGKDEIGRMRPAGGFTLLELVVVLAVIALATALIAPRLVGRIGAPRPPLVLYLEQQRARAIEKGARVRVYEQGGTLLAEPADTTLPLVGGTRIEMRWPAASIYQDRQLVAVFYPDGTSIASDFDFVVAGAPGYPDRRLRVHISPMQGGIAYGS